MDYVNTGNEYVTTYRCNICKETFRTKGEALAHHYKKHKQVKL